MTREEAIAELREDKALYETDICHAGDGSPDGDLLEALDMAIEALSTEHKHCWDCKHYEPKYNVCHAPEVVKQATSKLNNPCDSLLTEESNGSKEHKSKLDLISRQDVIEALSRSSVYAWSIEQDQTAHNWALNIIKALPSADAIHNGGVFVPNMEMPKACDYCLFHDSGWSWCKAKDKYCGDGKCPLIAVRGERREP